MGYLMVTFIIQHQFMINPNKQTIPFSFTKIKNPFCVPAGRYKAIVKSVKIAESKADSSKQAIKMVFALVENPDGPVDFLATKDYNAASQENGHLAADVESFLTKAKIEELKRTKEQIDLADLVGKKVDLLIANKTSPKYVDPLSVIDGLFPAGYLIPHHKPEPDDDDSACAAL